MFQLRHRAKYVPTSFGSIFTKLAGSQELRALLTVLLYNVYGLLTMPPPYFLRTLLRTPCTACALTAAAFAVGLTLRAEGIGSD